MNTKLCYVYGPHASGKGTLCRLLDGHSKIEVTIHHDAFPKLLDTTFSVNRLNNEKIYSELRKALIKTRYYQLEDFAHYRSPRYAVSAENRVYENVELDFYQMDQDWTERIITNIKNTEIIKEIFHSLFNNLEQSSYEKSTCEYYVGMGDNKPNPMRKLLQQDKTAKIIFLHRDPRAVIAAKGSRPHKKDIEDYIMDGRIFKINNHINTAYRLKNDYPNQILIVSFEDLILNTESTMEKISDFLNLKLESVLYHPSFLGNELTPKSNYIGVIKDDWKELVSENERCALDLQSKQIPKNINLTGLKLYISSLINISITKIYKLFINKGTSLIKKGY